jgi:hypothetical protein
MINIATVVPTEQQQNLMPSPSLFSQKIIVWGKNLNAQNHFSTKP